MTDEICPKCNCPVHPCLPCEEVVLLNGNHTDEEYNRLLRLILKEGRRKKNRTGVDTIGVFGAQAKFDVSMDAFPILTTKRVHFKSIVHELLWFIKGDTNIKYLVDNNVHIWDEWAYKRYVDGLIKHGIVNDFTKEPYTQDEFIQKIKTDSEFAKKWGDLGEGTYGGMWRAFPYAYETSEFEYGAQKGTEIKVGHVDQLQKVMDKLTNNPDDRRMIVSAWHPYWIDYCALPPCHCLFHFNTEELTVNERWQIALQTPNFTEKWVMESKEVRPCDDDLTRLMDGFNIPKRRLNLLLYQRSVDSALGLPFNISSYSLLLAMVAHCVGMEPGVFTHTYGDLHIYQNHLDGVKEQLSRTPKVLPKLWLNPDVKDLFEFKYEDIKLIGYDPHSTIKFDVAV